MRLRRSSACCSVSGRPRDVLRTNLSTRPFYNDRAVTAGMVLVGVLVLALAVYNVSEIVTLTGRNRELGQRVAAAEARAAELRTEARTIRQTIDASQIEGVQAAAQEANSLIEQRAFSWTNLFNRFEATLPADVRISAVQPQVDVDGRMLVSVTAISRRVEDLDAFIEQLEQTGAFRGILSRQEEVLEDGTLRSVIQGYYGAPPPPPPDAGPATANAPPPAEAEEPAGDAARAASAVEGAP